MGRTEVACIASDRSQCVSVELRGLFVGHFGKVFKGTMQLKEDSDDVDVVAIKTIQGDVLKSAQNID